MSPANYSGISYVWTTHISGGKTNQGYHVRPVINIKGNLLVTGSGGYYDPYVVITE